MNTNVRRVFVEKKEGFDVEARGLFHDLKGNLGVKGLKSIRILNRYDISGISDEVYQTALKTIFSEPPVDLVYDEEFKISGDEKVFAVEYLPGQYDQRADSASQCIQIIMQGDRPNVKVSKVIVLKGEVAVEEIAKIKEYIINPVESREAVLEKPRTLENEAVIPEDVKILEGFNNLDKAELSMFLKTYGLAMSHEDLEFCQKYFKDEEKRDPTITEIRMLDTYWSDHCRHTTFLTKIEGVEIQKGSYEDLFREALTNYIEARTFLKKEENDITLMDLATIGMKLLRKKGMLNDLEVSDEQNACSIVVDVDVDGEKQEWLVMFKNETHNHPTEIEPFGGASTCLGGAIRDPLSGRAYVYQAMRVTGSGDPRVKIEETISGKLPQRKITTEAAAGYSSYGNQIGLATGHVAEVYDNDFIAKRMEVGAVIAAVPKAHVQRGTPAEGDVIILLGGRTGRDGCGGATGSSKEHDEESLLTCGAEVQKGNAPTERKIQRLFRRAEVTKIIKKCNDFGAGGVAVAIGELADGIEINLDAVPKKYEGLDGTELAISESQERMAVLLTKEDSEFFIKIANEENLEAILVAKVTAEKRVKMLWRDKTIVNISRDFLNTNGVKQSTKIVVKMPDKKEDLFDLIPHEQSGDLHSLEKEWCLNLERLNICSQRGLVERFDGTIGANTVLLPFGGKYQLTPAEAMAAKIPVQEGETSTGTIMSYGYNPLIGKWSPFHGAVYAVVEALAKITACGGDIRKTRMTFQEYFEKLGKDPEKWGKPFSALLGAYYAQIKLGIPSIGGKDSMSGTFKDMNVPPTLVAFAVNPANVNDIISPEFKKAGNTVVLIPLSRDKNEIPHFDEMERNYEVIHNLIKEKKIISAHTVKAGGVAETISKMCFGNMLGFEFVDKLTLKELFAPQYGSIIVETDNSICTKEDLNKIQHTIIGKVHEEKTIHVNGVNIDLELILKCWQETLESIFPTRIEIIEETPKIYDYKNEDIIKPKMTIAKPRIFIPVFPGTNCEYDSKKVFEKAGGIVSTFVIKNLNAEDIKDSIDKMVKEINNSQIIMIPGGFSAGDEPDGSGKFIAAVFRNPRIREAVMELLKNRDGLMLGICNGFQALIKLGLVPYGEIRDMEDDSPTLTFNAIGRHMSKMVITKIVSNLSPWFNNVKVGDVHTIPISHGEGRFTASAADLQAMARNGQIATQYVDFKGNPTYDINFNPNSSLEAIEGITSPDGRVLGKMAHSERIGSNVIKNVPGEKNQRIFEAGVKYFK
ncbi:MAG: phosphoribosylformylglycinamidine synthase [Deltaproteobacteria bacterium]